MLLSLSAVRAEPIRTDGARGKANPVSFRAKSDGDAVTAKNTGSVNPQLQRDSIDA